MSKIQDYICEIRNDKLAGAIPKHLPKKFDEESLRRQFFRREGVHISSACWDRDGCLAMFSYATLSPLDLVDDAIKNKIRNQINTYEVGGQM